MISDEQLMQRVRDFDCLESFQSLFEGWKKRIHRLCCRMTGDWQNGEDLVQEVFTRLFQHRERYVVSARFSTFIWRIAINQCRDFSRRSRTREEHQRQFSIESSGNRLKTNVELEQAIESELQQLPIHYREVVLMRHFEGMQFCEIAQLLNLPRGTVASRMAAALKLLGPRLREFNRTDGKANQNHDEIGPTK